MTTTENKKEPTATETYEIAKNDIANLMGFITSEMTKPQDKITWGAVGNLHHVRRNLVETVAFLSNLEETDVEAAIKNLRICATTAAAL